MPAIDDLDTALTFRLDVLLALVAHGLAAMLPVFTEQPVTAADLIQAAIVAARHDSETLQKQIDAGRER
jgi:hypothetical protein